MLERRLNAIVEAVRVICKFGYRVKLNGKVENGKYIFDIDFSKLGAYEKKDFREGVQILDMICSLIKREHNIDSVLNVIGVPIDISYSEDKAWTAKVKFDAFGDHPIPALFKVVDYVPPQKEELVRDTRNLLELTIENIAKKFDAKVKCGIDGTNFYIDCADKRKIKKYREFEVFLKTLVHLESVDITDVLSAHYFNERYASYYTATIERTKKKIATRKRMFRFKEYYYDYDHNLRLSARSHINSMLPIIKALGGDTSEIEVELKHI